MSQVFCEVVLILTAVVSSFGHAQQCGVIVSDQTDFVNTVSTVVENTFEELSCPAFESRLNTISSNINALGATVESRLTTIETSVESRLDTIETSVESRLTTIETAVSSIQQQLTSISEQLSSSDGPPRSCADILARNSNAQSGMYEVRDAADQPQTVYCDMTTECEGLRGWARIAYSNASERCPGTAIFKRYNTPGCEAWNREASCSSTHYPSGGILYKKVCGRIYAHAKDTTDGFIPSPRPLSVTIDSYYLDGISLTHGSPRQHIWSFASTFHCRCGEPPAFVGENYFCEFSERRLDKTLFAGQPCNLQYCPSDSSICTPNGAPWFYRDLPSRTSDDIELRLCRDQGAGDEDIYLTYVEVLVR